MPTFSALQNYADEFIRKGIEGLVAVKLWESGDAEVAALQDGTGLLALPTGYETVGRITKDDGVTWSREVSTSDVTSLGASQPTRTDITSDVTGLQFTMQESKAAVMGMHGGVDLSAVTQDATGNVAFDKPDRPRQDYYRVLVLFKDGDGADAIYFAKWLPRARVTDRGEQMWNEENALVYPVTLSAFVDSTVGTAVRELWAGPAATLTAMGFAVA